MHILFSFRLPIEASFEFPGHFSNIQLRQHLVVLSGSTRLLGCTAWPVLFTPANKQFPKTDRNYDTSSTNKLNQQNLKALFLTSDDNVGGFLCRITHVVTGYTAVNTSILCADGRYCEGLTVEIALLWKLFIVSNPCQGRGGLASRDDAHQDHCLSRVGHNGVFHKQLNSWGG